MNVQQIDSRDAKAFVQAHFGRIRLPAVDHWCYVTNLDYMLDLPHVYLVAGTEGLYGVIGVEAVKVAVVSEVA